MDIDVAMGASEPSMGAAAGFSAQLEGINSGSVLGWGLDVEGKTKSEPGLELPETVGSVPQKASGGHRAPAHRAQEGH